MADGCAGTGERPLALVVDADLTVRGFLRDLLEERSVEALEAASGAEAIDRLRDRAIELLLIDPETPGADRPDVLQHALALAVPPLVVVSRNVRPTGSRRSSPAVSFDERDAEWTAAGVFDFLGKPIDVGAASVVLDRALRQLELVAELLRVRRELQSREGYYRLVGRGPSMDRLRAELERVAVQDCPVLVVGPEGSGKELVARNVHLNSPRAQGPFVVYTCTALSDAGAWHSPGVRGPGLLEPAAGGSIYLDGVTALPIAVQEGLLSTLDGRSAGARGDTARLDGSPDVRLIASAPLGAREAVDKGLLIEELAAHLMPATLTVAGLRERVEDIPLLASHFARTIAEINHLRPIRFAAEAMASLEAYAWPGNVRELRQAIEHAVILASDGTIRNKDLPDRVREGALGAPRTGLPSPPSTRRFREAKREVVETFEQQYLRDLLQRHSGNVTAAAQQAGMLRSALQRLLRKYALRSADFRASRRSST